MTAAPPRDLEVAVIAPLEDPRGEISEHLGTWMHDQGLARERYQLVVAGNGEHPDFERDVARVLAPHDSFVAAPGASIMEMYAKAAEAANARVLLLTEAHCRAEPGCLRGVTDAFASDQDLAAVMPPIHQRSSNALSELIERWLAQVFEAWDGAGWRRFNNAGVAIRTEAYARAGGLDPRLDLYATSYLAACLHEQGSHIARIEGPGVIHLLEQEIGESLAATQDFIAGECILRAEEPEFCERYFGPAGLWERRLAYRPEIARSMLTALRSAVRQSPRDAGWLGRELVARIPAGVAGARPRWAWERALGGWRKRMAGSDLIPFETRWRSFASTQQRTVAAAQLRYGIDENGVADPAPDGKFGAERFDGVVVGAHGLEQDQGRQFRWTEPVSLLRLAPAGDSIVRVNTAGLRGRPLDYLHGVYVDGEQLPPELVTGDSETLEVQLPARLADAVANSGIVLICRPLVPSREGSSDERRLGMPVVELELSGS